MRALVIGAGRFGSTVAVEMAEKKCDVVVIDSNSKMLDDLKDVVSQAVIGDATDKDLLVKFAKEMDVVIVCVGERVDASLLITHWLKELGIGRIIVKASSRDHEQILKIIGAHQVVFPERDSAIKLVASIVAPSIVDFVQVSDDLGVVEIAVPEQFIGKTIGQVDLRNRYGIQILAVKNPLSGKTKMLPTAEYVFQPDDVIIMIGDAERLRDDQS
ncbi:MAG TPA: TrkA family potassium uptake protein [bacterium]